MNNNAYLLRCRATGEQLLIDAAAEPDTLLEVVGDGRAVGSVVTTHQHGDHWQALREVVDATGARTYAGRGRRGGHPGAHRHAGGGRRHDRGSARSSSPRATWSGHTPGSIALVYDDPHGHPHLFTGDCLFPGGVGNTHDDPAAFATLLDDVTAKLFDGLPDETWVYPGHGNDTTLGTERPHLAEWRARGW